MATKFISSDQDYRNVSKILNLLSLGFAINDANDPATEGVLKYVDTAHVFKYRDATSVKTLATLDDLSGISTTFAGLADTTITTPVDANVPLYDSSDGKWKNKAISGDLSITKAGVATVSSFTTANEATDTTCFPVFVTAAASANSAPKTNANLTFDSSTGDLDTTKLSTNTVEASSGTASLWTGGVTTINVGSSITATSTYNLFTGATISGATKTVNIGTAGVSGSTTSISIGSSVSGNTSTIDLYGTVSIRGDASLRLYGSSTGYTVLDSANSSSSNYTVTIPARTMTLAGGSSSQYYLSVWDTTNTMTGIAPSATSGNPLVSAGSSANPTWSNLVLTNPASTATLTLANNSSLVTVGAYVATFTFSNTTSLTFPTTGTLATTAYVDSVVQGLSTKDSVRVSTTAELTNVQSWSAGTFTFSADPGTQDGVTLTNWDRILVKSESTNPNRNGIYTRTSATSWTRTEDANAWDELVSAFVFVEEGTSYADTGWVCQINAGGTLNTTNITWAQFSSAGVITGARGIYQSGTTLSVGTSSNYTIGDLMYATSSTTLGYLSTVGVNRPLVSGAAGSAPLYSNLVITNPGSTATLTLVGGSTLQTTGAYTLNLTTTASTTPTFLSGTTTVLSTSSAFVSGGVPYFSSTGAVGVSALLAQYRLVVGGGAGAAPATLSSTGTANQFLVSGGSAANPTWSTATLATTYAQYDLLYASAANTVGGLTKGTQYMTLQAGASGVPTWATIALGTTSYFSGQLGLTQGGTNASITAVAGGIIYSGASALAVTAAGSSGAILRSTGTTAPAWTTYTTPATTTAYSIFAANAANVFSTVEASEGSVLSRTPGNSIAFNTELALGRPSSVAGSLKLYNAASTYYISFTPGTTAKDCAYTLPVTAPASTQDIMVCDSSGVMSWANISTIVSASSSVPSMYKANISGTGGTVTAATHGCGTTPIAFVIELISTTKYLVEADITYNASGDITWAVNSALAASSVLFIMG